MKLFNHKHKVITYVFMIQADALSCLSQKQQLFCSAFVKERIVFFATGIRNLCHPARISPPHMERF